jgi:hypothetical protein
MRHTHVQVQLTEEETEYSVVAVKHVFDAAIALQFTCSNTVAEQILENVTVAVDLAEAVRKPDRNDPASTVRNPALHPKTWRPALLSCGSSLSGKVHAAACSPEVFRIT